MRDSLKWLALLAIVPLAVACGTDSGGDSGDKKQETDAGATDGGGSDGSAVGDTTGGGSDGGAVADSVQPGDGGQSADTAGTSDGGASTKMQTCTELGDCVIKACAPDFKDGCTDKCLSPDNAEVAALAKAAPLLSCVKEVCLAKECSESTDSDCLDSCMNNKCTGHLLKCVEGGTPGDKPCVTALGCFDSCGMDKGAPFACLAACVAPLDANARKQLDALATCAIDKGDVEMCIVETIKCYSNDKAGDKPCGYFQQCQDDCEANKKGDTCTFDCFAALDKEAQDLMSKLVPCFGGDEGSGSGEPPPKPDGDPAADKAMCMTAAFQCALHKQSGTQKCHEVFACSPKCVADAVKAGKTEDEAQGACMMQCAGKLTVEDQKLFMAAAPCFGNEKQPGCDAKIMGCINPSGTKNCVDVVKCTGACPDMEGDPSCMFGCLHDGTPKDAAAALGVFNSCGGDDSPSKPGDPPKPSGPSQLCIDTVMTCGNPSGTGKCADMQACFQKCMGPDPKGAQGLICGVNCTDGIAKTEAQAFGALMMCSSKCEDQCKSDQDPKTCSDTCMAKDCAKEIAACPAKT